MNKVLSFEEFDKYINRIQTFIEVDSEINTSIRKLNDDLAAFSCLTGINEIIHLLEFIFSDKEEWITFWMFEMDFGASSEQCQMSINKKPVILKTSKDLYDLLVKNMEDSKEDIEF